MQVLVTGAAGEIGKSLTTSLLALGHRVRALDIKRGSDDPALEWICADSTDVSALRAAMVGCDAIIHLAALGLPWLGTEEEVFRVNDYGTFCVYRAAAESGVGRVVAASSINALGMYFGLRSLQIDRIPVTEDHRRVTSDIYSFSKQIQEDIAEYFYRREGITSISIRMGADMKLDAQPTPAPIRDEIARLLALPRAEGQRHVHEIVGRFFARSRDLRERYTSGWVPNAVATGVMHLWTVLDSRDRDRAFALALAADVEGAVVVNVSDSHNALVMDAREIASLCYPEAELAATLQGTQSLWSGERARTLLGFEPQYSVARFFE